MKRVSKTMLALSMILSASATFAQQSATITIDAAKKEAPVAKTLHGIFFEEISHAGEGGIYAELIQNRGFEDANIPPSMKLVGDFIEPPRTPAFTFSNNGVSEWKTDWPVKTDYPAWSYKANGNAAMSISRSDKMPLNSATPHSLQVDISKADKSNQATVLNEGFWGIKSVAGDNYNLNFYLRSTNYKGSVTASLQSEDGTVLASATISLVAGTGWKKYSAALTAKKSDNKARFVLSFDQKGTVWLDFVSLFPAHTFKDRPNGLRQDIAQYVADLHPAFIRWPGGCFVEGMTIAAAPAWKETIGPVEKRTGTYSIWNYWTSNGFGYQEYLQYCEDIGAAAMYVINAGMSCEFRSGTYIPDDSLQQYIQNSMDAIEYAIGPVTSKYGKMRADAGHPKPYPLKYIEIGNEQSGPRYAERYNLFNAAIKQKYPQLITVASMGIGDVNDYTLRKMQKVDFADEHAYKAAGWAYNNFNHFDSYPRGKWDVYAGEWATNGGVGFGNLEASLSDAVYMMGMEKNGDLVKMSSYAPLLVNTNDIDWPVNLINFNDSGCFGRISYYTIKMFNENRPSVNLQTDVQVNFPTVKKPLFGGGIGLATWDTKTAYKDIEVIQDGNTVYKSDFAGNPDEWSHVRGDWSVQGDALAQTAMGAQQLAVLKDKKFDTYTLKMKAKKLEGGGNAFIIPFAVKDDNNFLRVHIGGYVNRVAMFEKVKTDGYDVSNITAPVDLPDTIQPNRWYDIEMRVGIDSISCYLDGKLLMTYQESNKFFAIAGKDTSSTETIVKIVNGYDTETPVKISLQNSKEPLGEIRVYTISAPQLSDENSFDDPKKYVPVTSTVPMVGTDLTLSAKPFSITVLRLPGVEGELKKPRNFSGQQQTTGK